jgi:hypothetical protein
MLKLINIYAKRLFIFIFIVLHQYPPHISLLSPYDPLVLPPPPLLYRATALPRLGVMRCGASDKAAVAMHP